MARKPRASAPPPQLDLFGAARPPPPAPADPERAARSVPRDGAGLKLPEALRLETNLAVFAGAGTGKTYGLVTCALHLLSGARSLKPPVEPSALCMLTFTEKAAGEMRERLLERLEALADGKVDPDLAASFDAQGRPFPPPAFFRRLRDELGAAFIGTFHALCIQLLRQAPPGLSVAPGFSLLDERTGAAMVLDLAERLLLERVEAGDPGATALCRERRFTLVAQTLVGVWRSAREEGTALELVAVGDAAAARACLARALEEAAALAQDAACAVDLAGGPNRARYREAALAAREILIAADLDDYPAAHARLRALAVEHGRKAELKTLWAAVQGHKDGRVGLDALYGAMQIAPHEEALRDLMVELDRRVRARLAALGALDFTGLLLEARSLLRDHPEARREAQRRLGALLVDEFQDTNGVQLDLVRLLAEERSAVRPIATLAGSDEVRALPLEPGFLCIVGDRKQGIYEFRGADVSLMESAAQALERAPEAPGGRAWLKRSRRSTPSLVRFGNLVSQSVWGPPDPGAPDFEVRFSPDHDALEPHRGGGALAPCVRALESAEQLDDAEALVAADARAVAREVAALLADGKKRVEAQGGGLRPVAPRDVAVLFSRFTRVQAYEQALVQAGVRHRVVRGRGFFGAQEVVDLAGLLALLSDPGDGISLAAVLRSPLVGLSDASLLRLATALDGRLDGARLLSAAFAVDLPPEDQAKLDAFRALYPRLRRARHRLGVSALVQVVLAETGYDERVAAAPHGEQALGNLEKLLLLAGRRDQAGAGSCAAFARELLALAREEPDEAQGEVVEQGDAVTLCTIHQAKGLEWPVVVLADLAAAPRSTGGWAALDRAQGLSLKPFAEAGLELKSERHERVRGLLRDRRFAEHKRLLYVALTRARDLLVLGLRKGTRGKGENKKPDAKSLAGLLAAALELPLVAALVERVDAGAAQAPRPAAPPVASAGAQARLDAAVARAAAVAPLAPVALLPVTQLQDFVACPRRYHLAHQVGLAEGHGQREWTVGEEVGRGDLRAQGVAAHRLLERTPLALVGSQKLAPALAALASEEDLEAPKELLAMVLAFWQTPFGARLARAEPGRVFRELPFVVRLGRPDEGVLVLRGQLDLLWVDPEGTAWVLDYKTTRRAPSGLEPYRFQLLAYAAAARRFAPTARAVRAGVATLRDAPPQLEWEAPLPADLDALEAQLVHEARGLLAAQRDGAWPGRESSHCQRLGCGYRARCHPGSDATAARR